MASVDELTSKMLDLASDGLKLDTQSTRKLEMICEVLKEIPVSRIKKINLSWQQMNVGCDEALDYIPLPDLSVELFSEQE